MTGYTSKLVEDGQTFTEFALSCARAFGALIEMRDMGIDAEIPAVIHPSKYHIEAKAENEIKLANLSAMDMGKKIEFGKAAQCKVIDGWREAQTSTNKKIAKLRDTLREVKAWTPPTPDHEGLKKFMVEQLKSSIGWSDTDYADYIAKAEAKPLLNYYREAVASAERDIAYHAEEYEKEVAQAAERTLWVAQLRDSLAHDGVNMASHYYGGQQ